MASTGGPEEEFHHPRRKELLEALKDTLLVVTETVRPTAWACLWLSDIDKLESLVAQAQGGPLLIQGILEVVEVLTRIVPTWTQRKRLSSAASSSQNSSIPQPPSPPVQSPLGQDCRGKKRNHSGQLSRQRDQMKCVLTNAGDPIEVAHIYPYSMQCESPTVRQQTPSFWGTLQLFWSKERIDTWYNAIFSHPARMEVCQNLLCLSPDAHAYWEKAYFALRPIRISDDKKRLDVQFFWLSLTPHVLGVDILRTPSLLALNHGPKKSKLYNRDTDTPIKSGDEISLETDDPVLRPLPDFRLLEMQWFLHRVTAMSGAAESQDDSHDKDNDNDTDILQAWSDRLEMYTEDDWKRDVEESTTEHFKERRTLTQPFGVHTIKNMATLRGGYLERGDQEGEGYEGEGNEEDDYEEEGNEGEGNEGEGNEGEGHEGERSDEEGSEGSE